MAKPIKSLTNNLVDPIILSWGEALAFCRDNVCLKCRVHPGAWGWEGSFAQDRYYIECPVCREKMREGEYISVEESEAAARNQRIGEREMQEEEPRISTEQALKDLGF